MDSIEAAFDGPFMRQNSPSSMDKLETSEEIRSQFFCKSNLSKPDLMRNQKIYPLMDKAVDSFNNQPLVFEKEPLSNIAVDLVDTVSYRNVLVIFVITSKARLRRYVLWPSATKACLISEWSLDLSDNDAPLTIKILSNSHSLVLGTTNSLLKVPLADCESFKTQNECLNSGDPYCFWNLDDLICSRPPSYQALKSLSWIQTENANCAKDPNNDWSHWSDWQNCTRFFQAGNLSCLCRVRTCISIGCTEPEEIQVTNCTQDGNWSNWTPWSKCSSPCGPAFKTRERSCTNPSPQFGGTSCIGKNFERIECVNNPPCLSSITSSPINEWSEWGEWTECSAKCGGGVQIRKRSCLLPSENCNGCDLQWHDCNQHSCKDVKKSHESEWRHVNYRGDGQASIEEKIIVTCKASKLTEESDLIMNVHKEERSVSLNWSNCSTKCGKGIQYMYKGKIYLKKDCDNIVACSGWGQWSKWSSCINGERTRTRVCKKGKCEGSKEEKVPCFEKSIKELNALDDEDIQDLTLDDTKSGMIESDQLIKTFKTLNHSDSSIIFQNKNESQSSWPFLSLNCWPFNLVVIFCSLFFVTGAFLGILLTYFIVLHFHSEHRHQKLRWFKSSKSSNPYITADNFKTSNHRSSPTDCLLNGRSLLSSTSTPMLNYTLPRQSSLKRTSTIKAKLNLDQNF